MFRTVPLSIITSFSLYTQQWYMSYRFADSLRAGFGIKFYMFRTVPLSIIRIFSLYTQQWYMSYSLWAGSERFHPDPAVSKPVWHIPLLCAQWKTADDGQRNCPKHVEFYSKNKFEKLVLLIGFIIRMLCLQLCHFMLLSQFPNNFLRRGCIQHSTKATQPLSKPISQLKSATRITAARFSIHYVFPCRYKSWNALVMCRNVLARCTSAFR